MRKRTSAQWSSEMKYTLIGVFDNRNDAMRAEHALAEAGFPHPDIKIHDASRSARPLSENQEQAEMATHAEPAPTAPRNGTAAAHTVHDTPSPLGTKLSAPMARDAETPAGANELPGHLSWESIEHWLAAVFRHRRFPSQAARYRQASRDGSALVSVDVYAHLQVPVARDTLLSAGARCVDSHITPPQNDDVLTGRTARPDASCAEPTPPHDPDKDDDHNVARSLTDELGLTDPLAGHCRRPLNRPSAQAGNADATRGASRVAPASDGWHRLKASIRHGWNRIVGHR
ncbi:unnamed protein product (plasmid) [Mycetohabitans rhizoxinica HKI 454]|uniref:Uncharacterized protein n=2 Tax=Mycetohabitans rhizoxinica TaxID=412963 RepID=E5AVD7_MYCRK|nr:unnamed protein product [Mycetohabitans rhizoxinica HKI 454]